MATTPNVYQGFTPTKDTGGLTPLQLSLANSMANGNPLPFGVNINFLAAMKTFIDSDPLVPINFSQNINGSPDRRSWVGGYRGWGYGEQDFNFGFSPKKTTTPNTIFNLQGITFITRGDDIYLVRRAQDCGPDEDRYEQVFLGKRQNLASGTFAFYGRKMVWSGTFATGGGGNTGWGCCFTRGTKILMANGEYKNIEDVAIGEQVRGLDNAVNTVINFIRPELGHRKLVSINHSSPFMTDDHPVYVLPGVWKSCDPVKTQQKYEIFKDQALGQLTVGDAIATSDEKGLLSWRNVESLEIVAGYENMQVYNFELDGNHTYIAENFVVHNKGAPGVGSCPGSPGATSCSAGAAGAGGGGGGGGGKIICTKLYELGMLPENIYSADQLFGAKLVETRPDIYNGYRAWAEIVVDWMNGSNGPNIQRWALSWAKDIATPWAEHMAYKMNILDKDNLIGRCLSTVGMPICKVVGIWQRKFGPSQKPVGVLKQISLIGIFTIFKTIVAIGNLLKVR